MRRGHRINGAKCERDASSNAAGLGSGWLQALQALEVSDRRLWRVSGLVCRNVLAEPTRELRGVVSRYDGFDYEGSLPVMHHAAATRYVSLVVSLGEPIEIVDGEARSRGGLG